MPVNHKLYEALSNKKGCLVIFGLKSYELDFVPKYLGMEDQNLSWCQFSGLDLRSELFLVGQLAENNLKVSRLKN